MAAVSPITNRPQHSERQACATRARRMGLRIEKSRQGDWFSPQNPGRVWWLAVGRMGVILRDATLEDIANFLASDAETLEAAIDFAETLAQHDGALRCPRRWLESAVGPRRHHSGRCSGGGAWGVERSAGANSRRVAQAHARRSRPNSRDRAGRKIVSRDPRLWRLRGSQDCRRGEGRRADRGRSQDVLRPPSGGNGRGGAMRPHLKVVALASATHPDASPSPRSPGRTRRSGSGMGGPLQQTGSRRESMLRGPAAAAQGAEPGQRCDPEGFPVR